MAFFSSQASKAGPGPKAESGSPSYAPLKEAFFFTRSWASKSKWIQMADVNVNAPAEQAPAMAPPTRTDDQILPRSRWVAVGKSNCYLDVERSQSNPIYKIAVDILKQTNFFRAFIASSTIPSIYIQQFWDTVRYDKTTGNYSCQLDEQWFDLTKDTLRDALQITPVDNNNAFTSPPTPDALIKFVNDLGYPKVVRTLSDVVTNDMFQPWRALTTIINLCLGNGLQERMWEEFTQSIHTFIDDKNKLAQHTQGKKKATIIVIPSVRFSKLIIYHLQSKTNSTEDRFSLHCNEESVLVTLSKQYYNAYLEKVAKHQRYLAGEEVSDPDSPAPKLDKPTKHKATNKSKPSAPKVAPVTKPAVAKASKSQQTKSAPAKPHEKKRKMVTETSEAPSLAKRSKAGNVVKKRTKRSSLQLVDEFVDEGVPENEPMIGDEKVDLQKALEESLKEFHSAHQGPLPPVVIREPKSRKFQPLPEVQEKGKEKVSDEQVSLDLLTLQTLKKKGPADQFIFQRHTSTPTESSGHDESSSLYVELGLTDSRMDSDEEVSGMVVRVQAKGQTGPNPGEHDEGQDGPNPGDAAASQPLSSHVIHAGPNLEHMNLEASDTSIQPNPKQMDEEFTTTAYPNVQENLKLPTEGEVRLEEFASSTGTLSSLQNLDKELSFADQFLMEKSQEDEPEKTNTESEVQSMVTIPIHQDTSSVPLMTTLVIDLTCIGEVGQHMADLVQANIALEERMDKHGSRLYKLENLNIPHQVSKAVDEFITNIVDWAIQAPLRDHFRDFPEADTKEILHHRMWESNSYQAHEDHKMLYEALEKSMARYHTDQLLTELVKARRKKEKRHSDQSTSNAATSSSKTTALAEYTAWTTTDTRLKPSVLSISEELHIDDDTTHDKQVQSSGDEDIGHDHIPTMVYMTIFMDWFCKKQRITELKQQDLEGPAYEIVKVFHPNVIHLQYQMEECLYKLLTDQVDESIIKFNVRKPLPLEYLRYGRKSGRPALSISKMKATYYPEWWVRADGTRSDVD
ncbi:hypothetical protein Tco_0246290 [Tanacetum coccineum]